MICIFENGSYGVKALPTSNSNRLHSVDLRSWYPTFTWVDIPTAISSPIKGIPTISSSPTYNYEQVCLGESEGQHTSMHAIADIAL